MSKQDRHTHAAVARYFTCVSAALRLVHMHVIHSSSVLLSHVPLPSSHRYQPSGGALRRLKFTTLLHVTVWDIATCTAPQRKALEGSFKELLAANADPAAHDSCGFVALQWMLLDSLRAQVGGGPGLWALMMLAAYHQWSGVTILILYDTIYSIPACVYPRRTYLCGCLCMPCRCGALRWAGPSTSARWW